LCVIFFALLFQSVSIAPKLLDYIANLSVLLHTILQPNYNVFAKLLGVPLLIDE